MNTITNLQYADVALRCAWLRHHAFELRDYDPTGQLTAALFDFADLLEEPFGEVDR